MKATENSQQNIYPTKYSSRRCLERWLTILMKMVFLIFLHREIFTIQILKLHVTMHQPVCFFLEKETVNLHLYAAMQAVSGAMVTQNRWSRFLIKTVYLFTFVRAATCL